MLKISSTYTIYLRFFLFNLVLSVYFIFAQKLFDNNFYVATAILWIELMISIPLGAAIYARAVHKLKNKLPILFLGGFLWLFLGNGIFTHYLSFWYILDYDVFFEKFATFFLFQVVAGAAIFVPFFLVLGMMEVQLYFSLSEESKKTQWIAYVIGTAGLLVGLFICNYMLSIPSPVWIGLIVLAGFVLYIFVSGEKVDTKMWILILVTLGCLSQSGTYLNEPIRMWNMPLQLSNSQLTLAQKRLDEWTPWMRFTVLENDSHFIGFYNGHWYWDIYSRRHVNSFWLENDFLPSQFSEDANIALLGSGGGLQLFPLLHRNPKRVYAIDILPGLSTKMLKLGIKEFADPRVINITQDGRKFLEENQEQFDLIYLPNTDNAPMLAKNVFEPSHRLYSIEAMRLYYEKLKPDGMFIILKYSLLARTKTFLNNFVATMKKAGFKVKGYYHPESSILIGVKDKEVLPPVMKGRYSWEDITSKLIDGKIIEDDRPFYASTMYTVQSDRHLLIFLMLFFTISVFGSWLFTKEFFKGKRFSLAPLLCGVNYTLILLGVQLFLFFYLSQPLQAFIIGNILFLMLIGVGALLYEQRLLLGVTALLTLGVGFKFGISLALMALIVVAIFSGGFFPRLLHQYSRQLPVLLVLDGLGAAIAGAIYLSVPTFFSIQALVWTTGILFFVTGYAVYATTKAA